MNSEEKIRKIMNDATEKIIEILRGDTSFMNRIADSIDDTANKILKDSFDAKTLLVDENNIDIDRYQMFEYIPDDRIQPLYESCKTWATSGDFGNNREYERFCNDMAMTFGTSLDKELELNVNNVIFKYKSINGNSTGSFDGEAETEKV